MKGERKIVKPFNCCIISTVCSLSYYFGAFHVSVLLEGYFSLGPCKSLPLRLLSSPQRRGDQPPSSPHPSPSCGLALSAGFSQEGEQPPVMPPGEEGPGTGTSPHTFIIVPDLVKKPQPEADRKNSALHPPPPFCSRGEGVPLLLGNSESEMSQLSEPLKCCFFAFPDQPSLEIWDELPMFLQFACKSSGKLLASKPLAP